MIQLNQEEINELIDFFKKKFKTKVQNTLKDISFDIDVAVEFSSDAGVDEAIDEAIDTMNSVIQINNNECVYTWLKNQTVYKIFLLDTIYIENQNYFNYCKSDTLNVITSFACYTDDKSVWYVAGALADEIKTYKNDIKYFSLESDLPSSFI